METFLKSKAASISSMKYKGVGCVCVSLGLGRMKGEMDLEVVQGKHKGKRAERLLTTGQIRNVLPALLRWHDAENDTFREGIQTVNQF